MREPTRVSEQAEVAGAVRPRVVVVAQASPAQGGIATYAETVVGDRGLRSIFDLSLLNTTRRPVRKGGAATASNAWHAVIDSIRVFRSGRRADVVHVQTALLPTLPLVRALALCTAARLAGAKVLCHVHTGQANASALERFTPTLVQRLLLPRFAAFTAVLTVSRAGTEGLRPWMPGARLEAMDNAVEVRSFDEGAVEAARPRVLFVGTIARRKGLLDLAEALKLLKERGVDDWDLDVVGAGNEAGDEEAEVVRSTFRSMGLEASLLGPLSGGDLRSRLRGAAIYVLPSHTEGQPIGVIEAMASGLATVATRVGALPDMLRDGVDGLLVDPHQPKQLAEALEKLIAAPALRRALGESARRVAEERYDLDRLRERLAAIYRFAVAGR
jgi:glycosyltransferase involved in cell wall biosynthesis